MSQVQESQNARPSSWRGVARALVPIADVLLNRMADDRSHRDGGNLIKGLGPIRFNRGSRDYSNDATESVALSFSSVDSRGRVANDALDQVVFRPGETKSASEIQELVDRNLAGHLSWSLIDGVRHEVRSLAGVDHWNGEAIQIFDFDEDVENDLTIQLNFGQDTVKVIVRNPTMDWDHELSVVITDSAGMTFQTEVSVSSAQTEGVGDLGKGFSPNLPIQRLIVSGKARLIGQPTQESQR